MDYIAWIGYAAGILTTLAYLPQVKKVWSTRSAEDISYRMMFTLAAGLFLWMLFGFMRGEWPIILANAVSFLLALTIVSLKVKFG
jgi:MtN3 and saliva related transmembrane protein